MPSIVAAVGKYSSIVDFTAIDTCRIVFQHSDHSIGLNADVSVAQKFFAS